MSNARLILLALICASPAILLLDGAIVRGLMAGVVAVGIALMGRSMRPGEAEFLISIVRPLAVIAGVPALWMLIQILPLRALAHPIWASAETALGRPLASSISIDLGATLMALGEYLTIAALGLLSVAVAVDRQRAEWTLLALTGASALMALILTTHDLFGLTFLNAAFERSQLIDCVAMGAVVSAAASIRTVERLETRKTTRPQRSVVALLLTLAACAGTLAICLLALIQGASGGAIIAAGFGLGTLAALVAIRRLGLGSWGIAAIAMPVIGVAILIAASEPGLRTESFSLAFAAASPASLTTSQRMLDDAPVAGVGAGNFAALAPVYREVDDLVAEPAASTAAAAVAIELGRPMLGLMVATIGVWILVLLRATLRRGRDSFHPAAGAGSLVTILFLFFINAGLLGTAATMVAAVTLGLAFAQSKSRTVQP